MFPSTLYLQSDKDLTIIITTIGIDKEDDKIKLSALAVIPAGGNDISSNLEVFEGEGENVSEALDDISSDTGKKIGLAHCDCIALSESAMKDNLTEFLDYFIRTANLATNASLVATDGKAKDLLDATKSSNNLLDLSLRNIVVFEEKRNLLEAVNIEKFYRQYFTESGTFYMPILSTEDSATEQDSQSNGSESGGSSSESESSGNSGNGSGSGQNKQKKIVNRSEVAVIDRGKYLRTLTEDERFIYNLLSKTSTHTKVRVSNISDNVVTESDEVYEQINKIILPKYTFVDGVPTAVYDIILNLRLDEVIGENHSFSSIDGLQNFLSETVKREILAQVDKKLSHTLELMKADKIDILNLYTKFSAYHHGKWQEYLKNFDSEDDYLSGVDIKINLSLYNVV